MGEVIQILSIPIKAIEKAINVINNTGENKEKYNFFINFDWYSSYTFSMKTKFNNAVAKIIFYPGSTIIAEGNKDMDYMYVIVEGECNIVCTKTKEKFEDL